MSELLRHRHTVEQYGVRVEISTEAPRISHCGTRSFHTWYARGHGMSRRSDSGGCPYANRLYAHAPLPGETANPPVGGTDACIGLCGGAWSPFRGAKGCKDPALVTGQRDPGEPQSWPVKAFPAPVSVSKTPYVLCVSLARRP